MLEDCFTSFCNIENLSELPAPGAGADGLVVQTTTAAQQPLLHISNLHMRPNSNLKTGYGATPVTRRSTRAMSQQHAHPMSPHQPMAFPSPIAMPHHASPAAASLPPHVLPSSPALPPFLAHKEHLVNDSGFHDNAFRTSTPIMVPEGRAMPKLQRRCLLRQLPECLIIQLMRFRYDQAAKVSTKINTSVSIRLRGFNLRDVIYDTVTQRNDLTASNGGYVYELYGICLHLGASSTSHGHYISYCLDGDKWYRMDDQTVEEVNMEFQLSTEEIRQNAYLLFYRRMGTDNV